MTITRVYSIHQIRSIFKGFWLPTSLTYMLKREGVETKEVDGKTMYDADAVDRIADMMRR